MLNLGESWRKEGEMVVAEVEGGQRWERQAEEEDWECKSLYLRKNIVKVLIFRKVKVSKVVKLSCLGKK